METYYYLSLRISWRLGELTHVNHTEHCLTHRQCSESVTTVTAAATAVATTAITVITATTITTTMLLL